jgi:hypothetical protein
MLSHVSLMLFGPTSAKGTGFGGFMNVGTESATTTVVAEKAPRPTPFYARTLNCWLEPLGKITSLANVKEVCSSGVWFGEVSTSQASV